MTIAAEYRKALANYSPGGSARDMTSQAQLLAAGSLPATGSDQPFGAAMGPGLPLPTSPLDAARRGVTLPRARQYPVGINLQTTPGSTKLVDFKTLRMLAKVYDIARRCIEIRRQEVASMRWEITTRDPKAKIETERQKALVSFFEYPDRINGRRWDAWIKTLLEEVFVVDALAVYPHPTWLPGRGPVGSDLFALEILDGTTIKPLIDNRGSRPLPPVPAYQQILYGVPRSEMKADSLSLDMRPTGPLAQDDVELKPFFTGEELFYEVYNPSTDNFPYGFSNVEQIIINVNLALKRQQYWTAYFTEGSLPAGLIEVPSEEWDAKQWHEAEETWNSMLGGDQNWKHRVKFAPGRFTQLRPLVGEGSGVVLFDEWLAKITCIGFDVTPTELGLDPKSGLGGTGWSEQQENVLYRKSLRPLTGWIEVLNNEILATWLKSPDLQFKFIYDEIEDAAKKATQFQVEFESAQRTANEHRAELGLPPSEEPNANKLVVVTRQGPVLLEDIDAISKNLAGLNRDGSQLLSPAAGGKTFTAASNSRAKNNPSADPNANPEGTAPPPDDQTKAASASLELREPGSKVIDLDVSALRRVIKATAEAPTVILCRHGSTEHNEDGVIRGWLDPELSAQGKKDARTLAKGFKGVDVAALYCSGLKRSCDTAEEIGKVVDLEAKVDERFKPWNLGDFQGKPIKDSLDQVVELMTKTPNEDAPGGESFNDFLKRYIPALQDVMAEAEKEPTGYVVVVAHMRNMRAAKAWFDAGMKGTKVETDTLVSDDEVGPGGFMVFAQEDGKWGIPDEYTEELERETGDDSKKAADPLDDLTKWRTKALRAQKTGRSAAVAFESAAIPPRLNASVAAQLAQASTPDGVKAVFAAAIKELHADDTDVSKFIRVENHIHIPPASPAPAPNVEVHVAAPEYNVPPPPAPNVHVTPEIHVAAPPAPKVDVHIEMPQEPKVTKITDPDGRVTKIEKETE